MTVKELIQELQKFDENLEVGGGGHFGEMLDIYGVSLTTINYVNTRTREREPQTFVEIYIPFAGNAPD